MRIGHYMHGLWSPGGVATYLRRVSGAQVAGGHEVVFFDSLAPVDAEAVGVADGAGLVKAAVAAGVDILHLHLNPPGGMPGGFPCILTVHGHQPYCPSGSQFLGRWSRPCHRTAGLVGCTWGHLVDRCGSARPDRLLDDFRRVRAHERSPVTMPMVAISDFVHQRLLRQGYDPARLSVLNNPGPPSLDLGPAPGGPPHLLFMGRIVPGKGLAWLVRAAAAASTDVVVDVAGTGPDEAKARAQVRAAGLESRVRFHGWMEQAALLGLIRAARAVVVPSLWQEPAGLGAIEAATLGRAVIASAVGGLPSIVEDGVSGLLVEPDDVEGLTSALDRLGADLELARRLGAAGRERAVRAFSLPEHVSRLEGLYAKALAA